MQVETGTLEGPALNWAVAQCQGCSYTYEITTGGDYNGNTTYGHRRMYIYSWREGGSIIERERISVIYIWRRLRTGLHQCGART